MPWLTARTADSTELGNNEMRLSLPVPWQDKETIILESWENPLKGVLSATDSGGDLNARQWSPVCKRGTAILMPTRNM